MNDFNMVKSLCFCSFCYFDYNNDIQYIKIYWCKFPISSKFIRTIFTTKCLNFLHKQYWPNKIFKDIYLYLFMFKIVHNVELKHFGYCSWLEKENFVSLPFDPNKIHSVLPKSRFFRCYLRVPLGKLNCAIISI